MSNSVAKRSAASQEMLNRAAKHRALMGGTEAMRAAGEKYLPRFSDEDVQDHRARVESSWLFNGYKKTVRDMTGRVFDKPIEIMDAPAEIIEWAENVNMQGQDLSVFAREVFRDCFSSGISFILVDSPRREAETTRAEAAARNLRPYMAHIKIEELLGWQVETIDNVPVVSQVRISETEEMTDPDDEFGTVTIERVRVLDRTPDGVRVRLFEESGGDWSAVDEYLADVPEITIVPFYAERTGFFAGEPILEDLADVNIAHWQSQSDQRSILHLARVGVLHITGRDSDEPLTISPRMAVQSRDPQARMEWVEHGGNAIGAGRQDLKDLEFQMEAFGLQLLVRTTQSATGAALDAAKETSQLGAMADGLKDTIEQALRWMAIYGGVSGPDPTVKVNSDFGVSMLTPQEVMALLSAVNTGNISRNTLIEELKRRGFVRDDLDTDEEIDRIDSEAPLGLSDEPE